MMLYCTLNASHCKDLIMSDTLVLNADYNPLCLVPLSVIDWQTAVKAVFSDKVIVIKNHDDWVVRSQHLEFPVPSIIVTNKYINPSYTVAFNRKMVYLRDGYICQYCGGKFDSHDLTFDHVMPRSKGGETTWDNVVTACTTCNFLKGTDLINPKTEPRAPSYWEMAKIVKRTQIRIKDPAWNEYLHWPEELVRALG